MKPVFRSKRYSIVWLFITFTLACLCLFLLSRFWFTFGQAYYLIAAATPTYDVGVPISGELPGFLWPPPKPSATASLTLGTLAPLAATQLTFGNVDTRISEALRVGGYDEKSYYRVPNGFAIVTRLEQMNANGYPEWPGRWVTSLAPISFKTFSLSEYIRALFGVPQGRYRIFVFIITSDTVTSSGTPVSQEVAQVWAFEGANKLPSQMNTLRYTPEHTCMVYIYEFLQAGVGGQANQNIPSSMTGREHLERALLWDVLER